MFLKTLFFVAVVSGWLVTSSSSAIADEKMVTIQRVDGNRIAVSESSDGGPGRGGFGMGKGPRQGGGFGRRGKGRGRFGSFAAQKILVVPRDAKITSAMRERRTFEFRVGAEIPGGFKNAIFRKIDSPLQARIVTNANRIVEVNVIIPQTDINQSNSTASGGRVIAVRLKRPPSKPRK